MTTLGTDEGGGPAASPVRARRWLRAWAAIGGGITIDREGRVCPWRIDARDDDDQRRLLAELETTPGLTEAVRVVASTAARQTAGRALKAMGRDSE